MKTDKNTVIGFVLLGILFFVYFWYNNKQQGELTAIRQKQEDSIKRFTVANTKPQDTILARLDSLKRDSATRLSAAGDFNTAAIGSEQLVVVKNSVMTVTFTNKGAQVKSVELTNYKTPAGKNVVLIENNEIGYNINTSANQASLS